MGKKNRARLALAGMLGGLMLATGLALPAPASAMATVTALSSPNIASPFNGNLGTIQISGMSMNAGQTDDILVSLPSGITLEPYHIGQALDAYVSVPQLNPGTNVPNAFWAGSDNGNSVVQNAYVSNPAVSSTMISFWITAAPSSASFSGTGTVDVMLPVISVSGAKPGLINALVWDTDHMIASTGIATGALVNGSGAQLTFTATSLPTAMVGQPYYAGISTNKGGAPPYNFSVTSGQLPPGVTIAEANGELTGTPTTAGSSIFTVTVTDSLNFSTSETYTLTIHPAAGTSSSTPPSGGVSFSDIANSWARSYILKLAKAGVVSGYPDGTFRPDTTVTRVQFAKMLLTAMGIKPAQDTSALSKYRDYRSFAAWELPWLAAAVENHLLSGYPDGTLRPDQTVTRVEAAVIMGRTITGTKPASLTFEDSDAIPAWAASYVGVDLARAKGQGLFGTLPQGYFGPGQNLTRAGAAAGVAVYMGT